MFERHKLLFSFQMCSKILEAAGKLNMDEYNFFLRGGVVSDKSLDVLASASLRRVFPQLFPGLTSTTHACFGNLLSQMGSMATLIAVITL